MQKKVPRIKLIVYCLIVFAMLFGCDSASSGNGKDKSLEIISRYETMLTEDPENCFYLAQIAGEYQAMNDFNRAIIYYQKAISFCSDRFMDQFQLGICFYLIMQRNDAVYHMDQAIEGAKKSGDSAIVEMLIIEKDAWMNKWDMVKELEWNKHKEGK